MKNMTLSLVLAISLTGSGAALADTSKTPNKSEIDMTTTESIANGNTEATFGQKDGNCLQMNGVMQKMQPCADARVYPVNPFSGMNLN